MPLWRRATESTYLSLFPLHRKATKWGQARARRGYDQSRRIKTSLYAPKGPKCRKRVASSESDMIDSLIVKSTHREVSGLDLARVRRDRRSGETMNLDNDLERSWIDLLTSRISNGYGFGYWPREITNLDNDPVRSRIWLTIQWNHGFGYWFWMDLVKDLEWFWNWSSTQNSCEFH